MTTPSTAAELFGLADDCECRFDGCTDMPAKLDEIADALRELAAIKAQQHEAEVAASGVTHWDGCWRDPRHHACAVVMIERQQPSGDSGLAGFLKSAEGQRAIHEHVYWGAGEFGCPKEIKASNGELHTLMCKVCDRKGGDLEKYECWPAKP